MAMLTGGAWPERSWICQCTDTTFILVDTTCALLTSCDNGLEAWFLVNAWPQHIPCFWSHALECKHTQHKRHPGRHRYNERRRHSMYTCYS